MEGGALQGGVPEEECGQQAWMIATAQTYACTILPPFLSRQLIRLTPSTPRFRTVREAGHCIGVAFSL